jgi:hypothetical protein
VPFNFKISALKHIATLDCIFIYKLTVYILIIEISVLTLALFLFKTDVLEAGLCHLPQVESVSIGSRD